MPGEGPFRKTTSQAVLARFTFEDCGTKTEVQLSLAEFLEDFTSETSAMQGLKFDSALIATSVGECTANC